MPQPGNHRHPTDPLDLALQDDDQLDEIQMVSELMIAASMSGERLSRCEIDRALGLRRRSPRTAPGVREHRADIPTSREPQDTVTD